MTIPFALSEDGFEMHLAVNYLGHCLLTLLLAPSLEAAAQQFGIRSRIVCLSSSTHYVRPIRVQEVNRVEHIRSYRFSEYHAYSQSKSLVITFVLHFARQFPQFETFALHPGVASSHLYRHELVFRLFPFLLHGLRVSGFFFSSFFFSIPTHPFRYRFTFVL